jgi:hypothetical protein
MSEEKDFSRELLEEAERIDREEIGLTDEEAEGRWVFVPARPPKEPSQIYSLRLPVSVVEQIRILAASRGEAATALLREWVLGHLDEELNESLSEHRGYRTAQSQAVSSRMSEFYALLDDVAAKAQAARPRRSEGLTDAQTLALGLFVATFEVFLGMRALLRERLAEEARMLSRTLLDDTARLVWLARVRDNPDELEGRALRFVFDSLEYEGPLMRAARDNGYEWAEEELERITEELEVVKAEAKSKGIGLKGMPKPIDLLRSLGQESLYYWHVRASQAIHSSRIGFSARFRPGSKPDAPILIPLESPIDEVARIGAMAVHAFSLAMIAAADVLGWKNRAELIEYRERVLRLSSDLFAAIAGKDVREQTREASPG